MELEVIRSEHRDGRYHDAHRNPIFPSEELYGWLWLLGAPCKEQAGTAADIKIGLRLIHGSPHVYPGWCVKMIHFHVPAGQGTLIFQTMGRSPNLPADCIQLRQGGPGLEVPFPLRQGPELLTGGHDEVVGIVPTALAPGVHPHFREQAGAVVVEVGRQHREEPVDRLRKAL